MNEERRVEVPGPGPVEQSVDQTYLSFQPDDAPAPPRAPSGLRLDVDRENVGWVVFDLPGEKVNKLTAPVLDHLRAVLDEALRRNVRGLVFVSDKPDMFVAGADVRDIAGVTDPRDGAEKAAYGQAVFEAIARFPRTTIAVITGPCLGGGYELALACTLRLVENRTAVRIGLPEVKLGILPGFGGTQRLPQRVGLRRALDLILTGKTLPAKPAFRRGLVDALVPPGEGRRIANEILMETRRLRAATPGRVDRFLAAVPPLRNFIFKRARAMVNRKARPEHYPAPHLALDAIAGGFGGSEVAAYANEARLLGEAIVTPASKNLTWLFMNSGKTKEPVGLDLSAASRPERTAVLGAGVMGGGIAWLAGEKGYPIRIRDIAPEALEGALRTAGTLWSKQVRRRRLTPSERDRRLEKLSFTLDLSGFNRVDFVFEAVVENLEIKRKVIAEVEAVLPDHAVIASNTSSLRIEDIAAGARRPERIVGLHFFNPVDRMPLVEVVAGPVSSARAVATAYKLALDLGKTPVLTADCPGFLINRLLAFYLGEALALFEQGVDAETMDRALTRFGMPMGPFTLLDQIGLDVADKVTAVVRSAYGDRLPEQQTVTRLADQGHLGRKSGRGFYVYGSKTARTPNPEAREAAGNPAPRTVPETEILDRLLLPMVNEAARCLEESVVRRALDVDLATVMGTGFPPFRGGLLRWADARGVEDILERLESWSEAQPRFRPSEALRARKDGIHPV